MSDEQNRMVITRVMPSVTQTGKPVAYLYSDNLRLKFPEISLFDLSQLIGVGIDPNTLEQGEKHWCRFYACYTESDKKNQNGNPYKDITHLEPIDLPGENDAVVEEIRDLHATVAQLSGYVQDLVRSVVDIKAALDLSLPESETQPAIEKTPSPGKPTRAPTPTAKQDPPLTEPVLDEDQARRAFFKEAGTAANDKLIHPDAVKSWKAAVEARRISWRDALDQLRALVQQKRAEQKQVA